jgi:AcrR family transcriptional regulator
MTADVVSPSPDSPPERLLDAAERLVSEVGAGHLTLEAVARAAGVSKGGLLYHFPSKEALLQAMIDRHLRAIGTRIASLESDGRSAAERLSDRVRMRLECGGERRSVGAALIAACAVNPALMRGCRARYRELADELLKLDGGFERAALVLLAVDGLMFGELLHVSPYTATERARLVEALQAAADRALAPESAQ